MGINKTYDGTAVATVTLSDNRVPGDALSTSYTSAAFVSPNAGTGIGVLVSGISISGAAAGNYALSSNASTTANILKATPVILWAAPAPIPSGSALGPSQLNASANVSGVFTYNPASGAVLAAGNQTLSTTFTPTDSVDYSAATAQVPIPVTAPIGTAQVTVTRILSRDPVTQEIVVAVTLADTGSASVSNIQLTTAKIGSTLPSSTLPVSAGAIAAGSSTNLRCASPVRSGYPARVRP